MLSLPVCESDGTDGDVAVVVVRLIDRRVSVSVTRRVIFYHHAPRPSIDLGVAVSPDSFLAVVGDVEGEAGVIWASLHSIIWS